MERQTVSGWWTLLRWAERNQVWNWVKGEGESWGRSRVPFRYWSAWGEGFWPAGATAGRGVLAVVWVRWGGWGGVWEMGEGRGGEGRGTHGRHTD